MRLKVGELAPKLSLPNLDCELTPIQSNQRLTMVAFHRFAGCPFCNLRLNQLIQRYPLWKDQLDIVVIFDSSLTNLQKHALDHCPPFPVLADEHNVAYRAFGVEHSWFGVLKGLIFRFHTMFKALLKGYFPKSFQGKMNTMPASFILDEHGLILYTYYGKDEGDYLPFNDIEMMLKVVAQADKISKVS